MGSFCSKKAKENIETKNTETKYLEGCRLFLGLFGGCVEEFSMISKTTVNYLGSNSCHYINSMAKTSNNKS